jgi:hypothetical protein
VDAYLKRIKLASLFAFAAICLYFLAASGRGKDVLYGVLFGLPNLLVMLVPASQPSIARGVALAQSFAFACFTGFGLLIGLALRFTDLLVFLLVPIFLSQLVLFLCAAKRDPSEAEAKGGHANPKVAFSSVLTIIYLAYILHTLLPK